MNLNPPHARTCIVESLEARSLFSAAPLMAEPLPVGEPVVEATTAQAKKTISVDFDQKFGSKDFRPATTSTR